MKRVALYARVSTADQNPGAQLQELQEYAKTRQFQIYREYIDHVTGDVSKRARSAAPSYQELMRDARRKRFDVVLVWKFDRFARSLVALLHGLQTFDALGIDFIAVTQDIDTTTPAGRLLFSMVGAFAEFERSLIVERTRAGIASARKRGVQLGRPRDRQQEARILKLRTEGVSFRKIAAATGRSLTGVVLVCDRAKRKGAVKLA